MERRHGGPYDRGRADSYYGRPFDPHKFEGATYTSQRIDLHPGDPDYDEYKQGYEDNERDQDFKIWD